MIGLVLKEDADRDLTIESINRNINRAHEILDKNLTEFSSLSVTSLLEPEDVDLHEHLMFLISQTLNYLEDFSAQVALYKSNKETDEDFANLVEENSQLLIRQYDSMLSITNELTDQDEDLKNSRPFGIAAFALDNMRELIIDSALKKSANDLREGSYHLKQLAVPLESGEIYNLVRALGIAPNMMALVNYAYKESAKLGVSNDEILKFAGMKTYQMCYQGLTERLIMNDAFHKADNQLKQSIIDYFESKQDELNEYLTSLDN